MKKPSLFYLFKSGTLVGPVSEEKLSQLRSSGELQRYSWIIDDTHQTWAPVISIPTENPFEASRERMSERHLSGAFIFMNKPYLGLVKGMHSFGVEVLLCEPGFKTNSIPANTVLHLNLADETNENAVNAKVIFQSAENHSEGTILRLGWFTAPVQL